MRWRVGGVGVGVAVGWNIATLGPIATRLAHVYGVSLTTVGLFVTVQFVVHMVMQVPGGRAADRFGARTSALAGLGLILAGNGISLFAPQPALAFLGRAVVGLGTGFAFVGGSDYIRARGGSPFLQGIYGGGSVLAPGVAVAVIPPLRISARSSSRPSAQASSCLRPRQDARCAMPGSGSTAASSATAGCTVSPRSTRCRSASA